MALSWHVIHALVHSNENLHHPICKFPAEGDESDALPSYLSPHTVNKWPFHGLFNAMLVIYCVFFHCCWQYQFSGMSYSVVTLMLKNQ